MADYFVRNAPIGIDENNGTSELTPWETQEKVRTEINATTIQSGDTVSFYGQDVFLAPNGVIKFTPGATFRSYGSGRGELEAAKRYAGWEVHAGSVYKVTGFTPADGTYFMVWEDGVKGTRKTALVDVTSPRDFYLDDGANVLYYYASDGADPDTHVMNATSGQCHQTGDGDDGTIRDLIFRYGNKDFGTLATSSTTATSGWLISTIRITESSHHGLQTRSANITNWTIEYVEVDGYTLTGILVDTGSNAVNTILSHCTARDKVIVNSSGGISLRGDSTSALRYCTVRNLPSGGLAIRQNSDGVRLEYCEADHCQQSLDDHTGISNLGANSIVRWNITHHNGFTAATVGGGMTFDIVSSNGLCCYNFSHSNTRTGMSFAGDGHQVYNNAIYGNGDAGGSGVVRAFAVYGASVNNLKVKNNIIAENHATQANSWVIFESSAGILETSTGVEFDYNCYWDSQTHDKFIRWDSTEYATLAAFKAAVSDQEVHGMETDPLMVDPANGDFRLRLGSPCIDAGVDVGLSQDYAGDPVGSPPNIGAFEGICDYVEGKSDAPVAPTPFVGTGAVW